MRNSMLPKAVRESLKSQPTMADLSDNQRAEIQASQDMLEMSIRNQREEDIYSALQLMMSVIEKGETIRKHSFAYRNACLVINKHYGHNAVDIVEGVMDDGDKFTADGESRGGAYQRGGLIGGINEYFGGMQ
jgi:hypothetical protein